MNKEETLSAMGIEDPEQKKDPVIKKKLELDIDVSQHNSKDNPYQKLIFWPKLSMPGGSSQGSSSVFTSFYFTK